MQFPAIEDLFLTASKVAMAPESTEDYIEQASMTAGLITGVALAKKEAGELTAEDAGNLNKITSVCTKVASFVRTAHKFAAAQEPMAAYMAMISDLKGQELASKVAYAKDLNLRMFDHLFDSIDDDFRDKVAADFKGLSSDRSALLASISPYISQKLAEEGEAPDNSTHKENDEDEEENEKDPKKKKKSPFGAKPKMEANQGGSPFGGAPQGGPQEAQQGEPQGAQQGQPQGPVGSDDARAKLMAMLGLAQQGEQGQPGPQDGMEGQEGMEGLEGQEGQFADEGGGPEVTPEALLAALQLLHGSAEQPMEEGQGGQGIDINQLLGSLGGQDNQIEEVIRMLGAQQAGAGNPSLGHGGLAQRLAPLAMAGQQM